MAIIAWFTLPDSPLKTRWLTEEERQLAHNRIYKDTTDRREGTSVWTGLREAASDWRTWVFCLMDNLHLSANGTCSLCCSQIQPLLGPRDDSSRTLLLIPLHRLQELSAHRYQDAWIQPYHHSGLDLPALYLRCLRFRPGCLVIWPSQRENMAYHRQQADCLRWLRPFRRHPQRASSIRRHHALRRCDIRC